MPAPTDDELTALAAQLGMSRRTLEAFVEAWDRSGRHESLVEFLGVIPEQRASEENITSAEDSRTA